ncbi:MAG: hypothetical protein QM770_13160 [Tepidisphaeraceae bacterium]
MTTKRQIITALAVLNVGLLGAFAWRAIPSNVAHAQPAGAQPRARGEYITATAEVPGGSVGVVLLLDQNNRELTALASDRGAIQAQPVIKLEQVFEAGAPAGNGNTGVRRNNPR